MSPDSKSAIVRLRMTIWSPIFPVWGIIKYELTESKRGKQRWRLRIKSNGSPHRLPSVGAMPIPLLCSIKAVYSDTSNFCFLVLFVGVRFEKEFEQSMANTQLFCLCFCFTKAVGH